MKSGVSIHKSFTKNLKHLLIRNQIFFLFIAISKSFYFFSLFITILMLFTLTEFTPYGVLSSHYSYVRPQKFLISNNIFGFLALSYPKLASIQSQLWIERWPVMILIQSSLFHNVRYSIYIKSDWFTRTVRNI